LKENVIVGRLIPAGTGFAYHEERRRKRREDTKEGASAEEVQAMMEEALSEAETASGDESAST
jgi:DNA-directed RNA polymerase subunit beta'